ncbi:uncharacterized protein G2W53_014621 [Senna tora]|uniref:Uncharacterized protein n=1 Tax=Senna tora TaxID=362788 RepID=A0A834WU32_9FABA|nr:uncharacterized protein G2W53_014621 [Senna tora]
MEKDNFLAAAPRMERPAAAQFDGGVVVAPPRYFLRGRNLRGQSCGPLPNMGDHLPKISLNYF